ncbi:hypothetical protein [Sulfurimonas indica]|nr:hypothetical protein [Sulfurimonas indica]
MYELDNILELQRELNIWEMEEAFAEINSIYIENCENVVAAQFGGN